VTTSLQDSGTSRIKEIDGWRAISVLLVIFHHLGAFKFKSLTSSVPMATTIAHYAGPLGVETFFVISGFVICRMLMAEEQKTGWVSLKGFYFRRVFRILPALWLYLVTCGVLLALGCIRDRWIAFFWASLFLFDLSRVPMSWFFGHTWSLAIEEQFYIIFPSLWVLVRKRWRSRVILALFVLCVLWNIEAVATSPHVILVASGPPGFAGICCGVLMAIHEQRARSIAKLVPGVVVALGGCMLILRPITSFDWRSAIYDGLVVPPVIALVLLFSMERGELLRRVLRSRVMQAIGVASYGIYLWQQLFTAPSDTFAKGGTVIPWLWPVLMLIVASSYFWIEKPAIRFGQLLSKRAKQNGSREQLKVEVRQGVEVNQEIG
jgi:peptidoglycan/LPS O-acetylase OafA/YrhL